MPTSRHRITINLTTSQMLKIKAVADASGHTLASEVLLQLFGSDSGALRSRRKRSCGDAVESGNEKTPSENETPSS